MNQRIEEDPLKAGWLEERIALYRELGWERVAAEQELLLAARKANVQMLKQL
ncbi:MAG: hypothetical protein J6386_04360 [Candidatus Synoicihabitans palmerolidicus]|nr:hypothetical protein [Candidatus Synoicihabitans palmerolidicus]